MSNQIRAIHPYWDNGLLVFDDPAVGLVKEPFVQGADDVLAALASQVSDECKDGFTLLFSHEPFPGYQAEVKRLHREYGGNWYVCEELGMKGWLCPALYKYFDVAPESIFVQIKERGPSCP